MLSQDKIEQLWSAAREERRDEINRFWQRSLFFWGFVAFLTGANLTLQYHVDSNEHFWIRAILLAVSSLFSFIMYLSSRASKKWQETWEKRVEAIEAQMFSGIRMYGASHKSKISENVEASDVERHYLGPGDWSVSRAAILINLVIFLCYSAFFFILLFSNRVLYSFGPIDWKRTIAGFAFLLAIPIVCHLIKSKGANKDARPAFDLTNV